MSVKNTQLLLTLTHSAAHNTTQHRYRITTVVGSVGVGVGVVVIASDV